MADRLSNSRIRGIQVTCCSVGLPECYLEELLENWLKKWQEKKGMRQVKLLIGEQLSEAYSVELKEFNRWWLRLVEG